MLAQGVTSASDMAAQGSTPTLSDVFIDTLSELKKKIELSPTCICECGTPTKLVFYQKQDDMNTTLSPITYV